MRELRPPQPTRAEWPVCPDCGASRTTQCPVCQTAGSDFALADLDPLDMLGLPIASAGPSCGPGGCTPGNLCGTFTAAPGMLLCPTCDEPFVPEYLRCCEWCGHEFPDGRSSEPAGPPPEEINVRTIAALAALGFLALGLLGYFAFMLRGK